MYISQIKELTKNLIDKELTQYPILVVGPTGIGKSRMFQQLANELGIAYVDLRLATQEVGDLIGLPRVENGVTTWSKPAWMEYLNKAGKGILVLEEVNRAPLDVRQAIFQLLTEHKLHTHELGKGILIVSAINPSNGSYHVNKLDKAFLRRFIQIMITLDEDYITEWVKWAKNENISEDIIRCILLNPRILYKPESFELEVQPTPAGYEIASRLLTYQVIPKNCEIEVLSGVIGNEAAVFFERSKKKGFETFITAKEIFKDYSKVRERYLEQIKSNRNDLIFATTVDIKADLSKTKLHSEQIKNLIRFLEDSNPETLTVILRDIVTNHSYLVSHLVNSNKIYESVCKVASDLGISM